jgi:hypothetical protein
VVGSCEPGNATSGCIKGGEFLKHFINVCRPDFTFSRFGILKLKQKEQDILYLSAYKRPVFTRCARKFPTH